MQIGFREATHSGLSFATDDLITPGTKVRHIAEAEKQVMRFKKLYERGVITEKERYNQVLDTWTHAREAITGEMREAMRTDDRGNSGYVNPVYLMADSGARGGIEQIRQLAGMRGLMAKPTGEIIETPIKSNFREGLTVLEYFSSTHGARKGLADTALKTADSGYLTRKLADVAQNVVVTMEDCGTTQGITKGVIYRGEKVEVKLSAAITGRVSRQSIVNPITDEMHRQGKRADHAGDRPQDRGAGPGAHPGPQRHDLRSPARRLPGLLRHGPGDGQHGRGRHGGRHHRRPVDRRAGHAAHDAYVPHRRHGEHDASKRARSKAKKEGIVKFTRMRFVANEEGKNVVLTRNGEISLLDAKGRELEKYEVPNGAILRVEENQTVKAGQVLCEWDPHSIPILSEVSGKVRFEDVVEGETLRLEKDPSGHMRRMIMEHKGEMHPQIVLEDSEGKPLDVYYLPERAHIVVDEGKVVRAGTVLGKTPREATGITDITGGLPRVTEIFEARKPKDPP